MLPIKENNLPQILNQFALNGPYTSVALFGSGHIHDTFRVIMEDSKQPGFILQRMNHEVFVKIPELMENIRVVTNHLQEEKEKSKELYQNLKILSLVKTKTGQDFLETTDGEFWRVFDFIPDSISYDVITSETQAKEGGKAFGQFAAMLADLPGTVLHETIVDFHNIQFRLNQFNDALNQDLAHRAESIPSEISFVLERAEEMQHVVRLGKAGKLPVRVTHNDTKFNNVLLNKKDQVLSVIDLDTVMPGYLLYDYGDSIRTIISTAPEDEPDVTKIKLRLPLLEAYTKGFLNQTKHFITPIELQNLPFSIKLLPYIMGVRFLTDYLNGDVYYKIHSPHHNLQRARAQFKLIQEIEENYEAISDIIKNVFNQVDKNSAEETS